MISSPQFTGLQEFNTPQISPFFFWVSQGPISRVFEEGSEVSFAPVSWPWCRKTPLAHLLAPGLWSPWFRPFRLGLVRKKREHANPYCFFEDLFTYLFYLMAAVGVHGCPQAFSACGESSGAHGWAVQASHCGSFSCCRAQALGEWALVVAAHGFSSCSSRALLLLSTGLSWTRDGLNLCPLHCKVHWTTKEAPPTLTFCYYIPNMK